MSCRGIFIDIFLDLLFGDCYYVSPFSKKSSYFLLMQFFGCSSMLQPFCSQFFPGAINLLTLVSGLLGPHFQ